MKEPLLEVLRKATDYLSEKNIENPRLNAELLLAHSLSLKRIDLYLQHSRLLNDNELETFRGYIKRRVMHEPVQYIIGKTNFYTITLKVSPEVLIPRPETEALIEIILNDICTDKDYPYLIVDVGTGSGAIALSLAHNLPNAYFYCIDISQKALKIALENAEDNLFDDRMTFLHGNLLEPLKPLDLEDKIDLIVSNPPYIAERDKKFLPPEIINYEPSKALFDGAEGISNHLKIIEQAKEYLAHSTALIFECGLGQPELIKSKIGKSYFTKIFRDYSDRERIIYIANHDKSVF